MTSKLRCPFCKEEIISDLCLMCDKIDKGYTNGRQIYKCNKCSLFGNKELWQALIQSQQDLEESQQATLQNAQTVLEIHKDLKIARKALKEISYHYQDKLDKPTAPAKWFTVATEMCDYADEALKQIEHKE